MITIEVDGKRIECADDKEARKVLNKAAKEAKRLSDEKAALRALSQDSATCAAFKLINSAAHVLSGESSFRAYSIARQGDDMTDYERKLFNRSIRMLPDNMRELTVLTPTGKAVAQFRNVYPIGVIENGAGWIIGVCMAEHDATPARSYWCGLGVHGEGDSLSLEPLHATLSAMVDVMADQIRSRRAANATS